MKISNILLLTTITTLLNTSCNTDETASRDSNCDQNVIADATLYETAISSSVHIDSISIQGDCLNITFSASGCDGDSWDVSLIDAEIIMESSPVKRIIRLVLDNNEMCQAYITKEISFDISSLQITGETSICLEIDNYHEDILYKY